ncbi:hypothetical protein [uncultured Microbacterium sp.]|uniref:hypothetical protein n=1 Tax=uncultured Microbacterium sp. TaxID=191216 RepID=UPI0035CA2A8B
MDPLWAFVAGVWWVAPMIVGAGALGWFGLRGQRTSGARHLEIDAAAHDVRAARTALTQRRADVAVAHAELMRVQAERATRSASDRDLSSARRALQTARQNVKSASAALLARRASLRAARASMPHAGADPAEYPLAKVIDAHNRVLARWMEYETDPAKLIAFPAMSDGRSPVLADFLREQSQAQWLRPASATVRMTPADFAAYRDAVRRTERAFDAAEREARGEPERPGIPLGTGAWIDTAADLLANAQRAVAWSAEAMARVRKPGPPA